MITYSISNFLFAQCPAWRKWRMRKDWQREFKPFVDKSKKLDKSQLSQIDKFWDNYDKVNPLFHNFYTQKTGVFHTDYLPDDIYYSVIDRFYNNPELARWLDDKVLYESIFHDFKDIISFPHTLCMRSGGYWVDTSFGLLKRADVTKKIFDAGEVFIKRSIDSCGGKGVAYFNADKDSETTLSGILATLGKNLVIQRKIIQSPVLASLNNSSVNTLRLISMLKPDGTVKIYSVVLRMGIKGSVVDNASSGGITVGVREDGRLKNVAYTSRGVRYDKRHPDSGTEFESIVIPNFNLIKSAVERLHHRLLRLRLLSWDFALDKDNKPILIEVNMNRGQLDFHQLNNGPLFGEDTIEILNEVYGRPVH